MAASPLKGCPSPGHSLPRTLISKEHSLLPMVKVWLHVQFINLCNYQFNYKIMANYSYNDRII